jgi:hypothetical protein
LGIVTEVDSGSKTTYVSIGRSQRRLNVRMHWWCIRIQFFFPDALISPCLKRIQRTHDDTCLRGVVQTREYLFKHCKRWHQNQKALWQAVKSASGRSMTNTSIKGLLWDRRCSATVVQYLRSTEIGCRVRERAGK